MWFTGLSGSGKTTLANLLKKELDRKGKKYIVFDGDEIRRSLHRHLGFTPEDIRENNRLIIKLCRDSIEKVDYVIVPIISPFKESRREARETFRQNFVEIYLNCPYDECKRRDTKGLYEKAERGEINNFIGLHIPYEPPENPEIEIDSVKQNAEEAIGKLIYLI